MSTLTSLPNYATELEGLRGNLAGMLPADALATFDADANQLQDSKTDILKLKVGDTAPDFRLPDADGKPVSLSELLSSGRVILVFYRGAWCPYCNLQLNAYQRSAADFAERNARIVAVSPQKPDMAKDMAGKNDVAFPVLTDEGNTVARQFTTVFRNGDAPVDTMTALGFDFDSFYEDDSRELPVPAVFVIETDRKISFARTAGGDYRNRVEPADILGAL